ncbi:MAG TPA: hypothetical protein VIU35_11685 [Chitinophagaceae bacterium]
MSLKKIKEKNPGFEFSTKATKKASESVKQTSLKSKLNIDSYNMKYSDQVSSTKDASGEDNKEVPDKKWKFLKKTSTNKNIDFLEEPKGSFFDEKGNEMAAED